MPLIRCIPYKRGEIFCKMYALVKALDHLYSKKPKQKELTKRGDNETTSEPETDVHAIIIKKIFEAPASIRGFLGGLYVLSSLDMFSLLSPSLAPLLSTRPTGSQNVTARKQNCYNS